jgi:quercetin dioxygenase-like cupin family protein
MLEFRPMSSRWLFLPFIFCAFTLTSQTVSEVEITAEPHHHFVLENEFLRVFDLEVAPQTSTLVHRHRHDYIYVVLGPAEVENAVQGKPPIQLKFQDGEARFLAGGFAHAARNLGSTPFRNVTIELLQDEQTHKTPPPKWDEERGLRIFDRGTQDILFVKDGVRVSDVELQSGAMIPSHRHTGPHLVVAISDLDLRSDILGRAPVRIQAKAGEVKWVPGGYTHTLTNVSDKPARFVTLEFH